jgi:DNA-binding response OmpR family regulator
MTVAERVAVRGELVADLGSGLRLSHDKSEAWSQLGPDDRQLVTPQAIARWTDSLADEDWTVDDIVRLEKRRRLALQTLRDSAELTELEWRLARFLQRREGRVCTYTQIAQHLWGRAGVTQTAIQQLRAFGYASPLVGRIQVMMCNVRKALEIDPLRPQHFANVRGAGYVFYAQPPARDDGIDYERRHAEHQQIRAQVYRELGLVEGEFTAFQMTDRDGMIYTTRVIPGPELHDEYRPELPASERSADAEPDDRDG